MLGGRPGTAHCLEAHSLETMSAGIGRIVRGTAGDRNSLLERDFVAVCPSRIGGFDKPPSIGRRRVKRARRSGCAGVKPWRSSAETKAGIVADDSVVCQSAPKGR